MTRHEDAIQPEHRSTAPAECRYPQRRTIEWPIHCRMHLWAGRAMSDRERLPLRDGGTP
jgi:hypothetical protein